MGGKRPVSSLERFHYAFSVLGKSKNVSLQMVNIILLLSGWTEAMSKTVDWEV